MFMRADRFLFVLFFAVVFVLLPHFAWAQRCDVDREAIFNLRDPNVGAYNIWDGVHGEQAVDERYVSGITLDHGHVFVVGERAGAKKDLVFAEIDRRGRIVWEKTHQINGLDRVVKMFRHKGQAVVLAEIVRSGKVQSWIGFFDLSGEIKSQRVLRGDKGVLYPHDLIARAEGAGFLFASSVPDVLGQKARHSVLYRLNGRGQIVSKRAYQTGVDNRILGLVPLGDGAYVTSGFTTNGSGRRAGWAMRLNDKMGIDWQREYSRGGGSVLRLAHGFLPGFVLVAGEAYSVHKEDGKAAWLMVLHVGNGDVGWQRYFSGSVDHAARQLMVSEDGLISILIDAEPVEGADPKGRDYVRMITLNPRGVMFDGQEFFNGQGADAFTMIKGPVGERVIIGATDMAYVIEKVKEGAQETVHTREGWILAAPSMDPYEDPCRVKPPRQLDDE